MASRAWATEVESANVRLVKVANEVLGLYACITITMFSSRAPHVIFNVLKFCTNLYAIIIIYICSHFHEVRL